MIAPEKSPGFPHPKPTTSFWLGQSRSSPYIGFNSSARIPLEAEVVVIGGGLSGVATAYFLLTGPNPPKSIVLVEARELASGATGRNGGHCRPDTARGFPLYSRLFDEEQALKIIANELYNLDLTRDIIKREGIDCDWVDTKTVDVAMDRSWANIMKSSLAAYRKAGGQVDGVTQWLDDPDEAARLTRVPQAQGACFFQAASLWPYKLVCGLVDVCVAKGLQVYTNTPASSMQLRSDGSTVLNTGKGSIKASKVVHCQNAFVATLLPEFTGKITPYRGQCSHIVPSLNYSGPKMLDYTYSFRYAEGPRTDFDYLIQRRRDGSMILGGGRALTRPENQIDVTDDSVLVPDLTRHLKTALPNNFEDWGAPVIGEGLVLTWTGIMGMTHDTVPYVGAVEGKTNHFINAGHCGHGMARIMSCAKGLAEHMNGATFTDTGLPECFQPTNARLAKYKELTVKQQWIAGATPLGTKAEDESPKAPQ